jgi:hypothetical protein
MLCGCQERKQAMTIDLEEMTTAPDFSSPSWHEDILKEREQRIRESKDRFVDWDQAKKDLRDSIP